MSRSAESKTSAAPILSRGSAFLLSCTLGAGAVGNSLFPPLRKGGWGDLVDRDLVGEWVKLLSHLWRPLSAQGAQWERDGDEQAEERQG